MHLNDDSHYGIPIPDDLSVVENSAAHNVPPGDHGADELIDEPTDTELVESVRDGDQNACEWIVRRYGPKMLKTARRMLNSEADALDAVQDAFLSAFKTIDAFEGRSQLGSWLYRIVVNASLMKLRSQRRRKERLIEDLLPTYSDSGSLSDHVQSWRLTHDEAIEMQEMRDLVRNSIAELPEPYRAVLLLRDIEELSTDETAEALDLSPGGVRTRLHRARQALKSLLDEHMTETPA